jgi:heme/copper-type cytochrome/quinol oxidase subunit 4
MEAQFRRLAGAARHRLGMSFKVFVVGFALVMILTWIALVYLLLGMSGH